MPFLNLDDVHLHYVDAGQGTPVTLLHGFTQTANSWKELAGKLPAGYRWLAPDIRGHGRTQVRPGEPYTMDACTADVLRLWDSLGVERSHLVGYSMGGRLALHLAAQHPERLLSLATIGAHAGLEEETREGRVAGDEELAARIEKEGMDPFVTYWSALPLFEGLDRRGPAFQAGLRADRMANRPAGLAASLRGMGAGAMEPVWSRLAGVSCPALFIAGALDHGYAAQARRLAAAVPGSRYELVARAGHAAHLERP
ncbi:MAG TPA: alpha/beta fold hydrolase, partial [Candidatus Acidoferrales bacterium]|nr:alpha/beta fold hydrolase [Candidatus Acidoferrales bacterium]